MISTQLALINPDGSHADIQCPCADCEASWGEYRRPATEAPPAPAVQLGAHAERIMELGSRGRFSSTTSTDERTGSVTITVRESGGPKYFVYEAQSAKPRAFLVTPGGLSCRPVSIRNVRADLVGA